MKKLTFLILVISLIIPLVLITACQQSVEPGENGFPTIGEIRESIYQSGYTPQVKDFLITLTQEKKNWIKAVNEIYLEHPNLKIKESADDYVKLQQLIFEKIPYKEMEAIEKANGKVGEFTLNFPIDYYLLLQKKIPHPNNGH